MPDSNPVLLGWVIQIPFLATSSAALIQLAASMILVVGDINLDIRVPPFPVEVVDTTGAGDAFTAGLIAAREWRWPGRECALFANACGAAAATTMGAGERLPGSAAVERLIESSQLSSDWDGVRKEVLRSLGARVAGAAISRSGGG